MNRTAAVLLVLVVGAATCVQAEAPGILRAERLTAEGASSSGSLAAFEDIGAAGPAFHLQAASLTATLEQESGSAIAGETPPQLERDEGSAPMTYVAVSEGVGMPGASHEVTLLPVHGAASPRITAHGDCAGLAPSSRDQVRPIMHVRQAKTRHNEAASVADATAWTPACPIPAWSIQGDFQLVLWETNLTFQHAQGNATYTTGASESPHDAQTPVWDHMERQLVMVVQNGTLDFLGGTPSVFLSQADVQASHIRILGARGPLPFHALQANGEDVDLYGSLQARVLTQSDLQLTLGGRVEGGSMDGRDFQVASAGTSMRLWIMGAPLLPLLVGAWAVQRRSRPERRLARLGELVAAGRGDDVLLPARRMEALPDLGQDALALRIDALVMAGRFVEARDAVADLQEPQRSMALAYVEALAGRRQACIEALDACPPAWAQAALRLPAFAIVGLARGDAKGEGV